MISQAATAAGVAVSHTGQFASAELLRQAATDPVDSIHDYNFPIPPFKRPPAKEDFRQAPRRRKPRQPEPGQPKPDTRDDRGHVDDYA